MFGFKLFLDASPEADRIIHTYLNRPELSVKQLAQMSEKSEGEIYRILHNHQISPNRLKVHHQKVENLANLGWKVKQIAEFTGYTPRNVRYILRNKNAN